MVLKGGSSRPNGGSNELHFGAHRAPMRSFHRHHDLFTTSLGVVDNPPVSRHPQFRSE